MIQKAKLTAHGGPRKKIVAVKSSKDKAEDFFAATFSLILQEGSVCSWNLVQIETTKDCRPKNQFEFAAGLYPSKLIAFMSLLHNV